MSSNVNCCAVAVTVQNKKNTDTIFLIVPRFKNKVNEKSIKNVFLKKIIYGETKNT